MIISELDYDLPPELIAQEPLANRDDARLMVIERRTESIVHSRFYKLTRDLRDGDLLVVNDTRVFPARLFARKPTGARVELLLVRPFDEIAGAWLGLIRSHKPLNVNSRLELDGGGALIFAGYHRPGRAILLPDHAANNGSDPILALLDKAGSLALPPYIRRPVRDADLAEYQTVYAARTGAVAAPTAGLHFTQKLIDELAQSGIRTACLTLHIGPGTFAPLRAEQVESHSMEAEWYTIGAAALEAIQHARRTGGHVIAVGTSSARALESYAITHDLEGFTGLFIHPGFRFKLCDGLITNFHMPRTTVLALVMAFASRDLVLEAYREAIRHRYRFLSYGDAMLIV